MANLRNVPVFILAGGRGTRLAEETHLRPKPMVEIGEIPILIHIMRLYYAQGFDDFVICTGYKTWDIKSFFVDYHLRLNDLVVDHRDNAHSQGAPMGTSLAQEKWRVRVVDTGVECMTGARLHRALSVLKKQGDDRFEDFALTYGDGLSDVDLRREWDYHLSHGKIGTVLGVSQPQRYGVLDVDDKMRVVGFVEKPEERAELINGGFFFFKRQFQNYVSDDADCILERRPMEKLAADGELMTFRHTGFWQPMDTVRDKNHLEALWNSGKAPWLTRT